MYNNELDIKNSIYCYYILRLSMIVSYRLEKINIFVLANVRRRRHDKALGGYMIPK